MTWQLVVNREQQQARVISITRSPFWIGRDPDCQLRPASLAVSRRHCALTVRDGRLFVSDCHTGNGTFVNDRRLGQRQELHVGDCLRVGPLIFAVSLKPSKSNPVLRARLLDEDAIAQMLLQMDGTEPEGRGQSVSAALETRAQGPTLSGHSPTSSVPDTASAAAQILGKYARRPDVRGSFKGT